MKRLVLLILTALTILVFQKPVSASHLAGMDLTYTCIGGHDYLVTLAFYRDCQGIPAPSSVNITFNCSSNSAFNFTATQVPPISGTGQEVTPGCSAMPTKCSGGSYYGLQEYVFQVQVTLPPCNFWTMSYSLCCRNPSNTIQNSTSASGYIQATLNNVGAPCNNSPYFTNKPVTVMCSQQTSCYNHGAIDPDGDSLAFSLVTPFNNGPTSYVTWVPPYSATQPLPSNPPVTIDPVTGDICMTPTMNIVSPMAVKVEEWREINGVMTMIGSIYRDLQVNVETCNNQLPQLSGMDTTLTKGYDPNDTTYFIEMCLGESISFAMWGYDPDVPNPTSIGDPDIFSLNWNNGIPSGTFQTFHQQTDSAYAIFSWTPQSQHVSNTPKCFTVTISDEACPYYGQQTFSYCITVRGMQVDIGSDVLLCQGESHTFTAVADTTTVHYIWKENGIPMVPTTNTNPSYTFNSAGKTPGNYTVSIETNDGGTTVKCPGIDQVTVNVVYQPDVDLGPDQLLCEPNTVVLDAGPGTLYAWSPFGQNTQTIVVNSTGFYTVIVDGGNQTRCIDLDSVYIEVVPMPYLDLGPDTCVSDPFTIDCGVPNAYYTWSDNSTNQTLTPSQSGNYSVTVTYKPGSGCDASDSKVVNIIDVDLGEDKTICDHEKYRIDGPLPPAGHSYDYVWYPDMVTTPYLVISGKPAGVYNISLDVGGGCTGEVTITVEECPIIIPNIITPNEDGFNDGFFIEGIQHYPQSEVIIYNRWGKKVFESTNYSNDKMWKALGLSDGVYYYVIRLANGKGTEYSGSVTVLR